MKTHPLVTIIVITYNSSKYVLETLESAKDQTYRNIELIISDDGSTDKTVELCRDWLTENKDRFVNSQILTVERNTGIPANCNRGVKASQGEWIKLIAGDDAFYKDAIEQVMLFLNSKPEVKFLQTKIRFFNENFSNENSLNITLPQAKSIDFYNLSAKEQHFRLQSFNHIAAPGVFLDSAILKKVHGFDEEFPMCEDFPLWLKFTSNNIKVYYSDILTVMYRRHSESVSISLESVQSYCTIDQANTQLRISQKYFDPGIYKKLHRIKYSLFKSLNSKTASKFSSIEQRNLIAKVIWKLFTKL